MLRYGHYLNEGRALGALVITTDFPPMNELVDADSGVLIAASGFFKTGWDVRNAIVTASAIESSIQAVIGMSLEERARLGRAARRRYVTETKQFHQIVNDAVTESCLRTSERKTRPQ